MARVGVRNDSLYDNDVQRFGMSRKSRLDESTRLLRMSFGPRFRRRNNTWAAALVFFSKQISKRVIFRNYIRRADSFISVANVFCVYKTVFFFFF